MLQSDVDGPLCDSLPGEKMSVCGLLLTVNRWHLFVFETGSLEFCYVTQANFKLLASSSPPASASLVAGATHVPHAT
jgi:hypothetical protein